VQVVPSVQLNHTDVFAQSLSFTPLPTATPDVAQVVAILLVIVLCSSVAIFVIGLIVLRAVNRRRRRSMHESVLATSLSGNDPARLLGSASHYDE
jgi:heme/copper-type cytochrome/quinol oxidase subunit 2